MPAGLYVYTIRVLFLMVGSHLIEIVSKLHKFGDSLEAFRGGSRLIFEGVLFDQFTVITLHIWTYRSAQTM